MKIYLINMPFFEQEYTKFSQKWKYIEDEYIGVGIVHRILLDTGCDVIVNKENSIQNMIASIMDAHVDTVMISVMQTSARLTYELVKRLREDGYTGTIFLGGWFAKMAWREVFLNNWPIDYVCYCDAEPVLKKWIQNPSGEYIGIADKKNFEYHNSLSIDQIRAISNYPENYTTSTRIAGRNIYCIETSRGCPHSHCTFCSQTCGNYIHNKWQSLPLDLVKQQIIELHDKYGAVKFSTSDDDMLGFNEHAEQRAKEIRGMIESLPFKITFSTSISVISATNGRILDYLKDAGLEQLCVGFESVDEMQLRRYGKEQTLEENYKAAEEITKREIPMLPGLITFDPFATKETVSKNLNFLFDNLHHYNLGKLTKRLHVLTGTPIVEMIRKAGLLTGDYLYYDYRFQNPEVELLYRDFQEYTKMAQEIQKSADRGSLQLQKRIGQHHKNVADKILKGEAWREYAVRQIEIMQETLKEVK